MNDILLDYEEKQEVTKEVESNDIDDDEFEYEPTTLISTKIMWEEHSSGMKIISRNWGSETIGNIKNERRSPGETFCSHVSPVPRDNIFPRALSGRKCFPGGPAAATKRMFPRRKCSPGGPVIFQFCRNVCTGARWQMFLRRPRKATECNVPPGARCPTGKHFYVSPGAR